MERTTLIKKKTYLTCKLELNLRKKLAPNLELSFVWCRNLDTAKSGSEIPEKFCNVVLQKDEEDQLDRSCGK